MTIEVVILLCGVIWGGVEIIKHTAPSWYDREVAKITTSTHERITALEKKIEAIFEKQPAAPAPTTNDGAAK